MRQAVSSRLGDALKQDLFDYYTRALQSRIGVTVNQTAIEAVNSRM
ncbi:hypothetical protein PE067_07125 [Paracoccus sp. DMF-8]|nr:hypothetical protein [Paracoccus sp. DMF-8]MDF3605931.1 hypothetical protein [Paracoccus sp. DMF-8]